MARKHVLIIGANFAGLAAARRLPDRYRVTVVDPWPWFEWLPNVHELVSGMKSPEALRFERRRMIRACGHRFVRTAIERIDVTAGRARTVRGGVIPFDACIVSVGGVDARVGVPGAARHSFGLKSVREAASIRRRLLSLVRRDRSFRVVIVGGGLEGIEALGEVLRVHRHDPHVSVTLIESGARLLPTGPAGVDRTVRDHIRGLAVELRSRSEVAEVRDAALRLRGGETLDSAVTVWTAGLRPAALLAASGLAFTPRGWAAVHDTLQSKAAANVFVAGDAAELPRPISKQAYHALDMGAHAAGNVVRWIEGDALEEFRPAQKPMLVAFGDLDTFLVSGKRVFANPALAVVKEAIFQLTMAQLDRPMNARALARLRLRARAAIAKVARDRMRPVDFARLFDLGLVRAALST